MHIAEQVRLILLKTGWCNPGNDPTIFIKRHTFPELAGTVSNGTRVVTLTICERGRYLSRVDGWGKVEKDVDLRDFPDDPAGAIAKVLK